MMGGSLPILSALPAWDGIGAVNVPYLQVISSSTMRKPTMAKLNQELLGCKELPRQAPPASPGTAGGVRPYADRPAIRQIPLYQLK